MNGTGSPQTKVAVFGLGYVGLVTAVCLARNGHQVMGVEVSPLKLAMMRQGQCPLVEPGLPELFRELVDAGRLLVTDNAAEAVLFADISFVCVGTPSDAWGGLDLRYVRQVAGEIGRGLRGKEDYHLAVFRSTMLPGTVAEEILPLLETESGKRAPSAFGVCANPEFMREGTSIQDFDHPPFTLIGEVDRRSGDLLQALYRDLPAPLIRTDLRTAEMVKYVCNAWHALKITFANEMGNYCKRYSLDSHRVMEIFSLDTKLNISPAYLKPGFAFGGSCLPKDLRALLHRSRSEHLALPVLEAIRPSNDLQIQAGLDLILANGRKRIGILGLSFKESTDDLRESPMVRVTEALIGKGYELQIYDGEVSLSRVMGANRDYIEQTIPHIASLMREDLDQVVDFAEVLVVGKRFPQLPELLGTLDGQKTVVDFVRVVNDPSQLQCHYYGICW